MNPFFRLSLLKLAILTLTFLQLSARAETASGAPSAKPNVLLVILEDWGPYLHCYGEEEIYTPNLDQLAKEGRLYRNCFSSGPVCSVGRSTLMVGLSQYTTHTEQHRTYAPKPDLPKGVESIPDIFRNAGYFTALGCGYSKKVDLNFTFNQNESYQGGDWSARKAGQPFYAHLTLLQTHRTWKGDPQRPIDPKLVTIPSWYPDTPLTRKDWALGLESAQTSDRDIGDIIARLKNEGLYDNTIIVITADHGIALPRGKQFIYDEGLHIPLIIRWPSRIPAGGVSTELVSNLDILPTILDLAGMPRPAYLQGRSLVDQSQKEPEYIFAGRDKMDDTHDASRTVRSHDFRYILNLMPERAYCQFNEYKESQYPGLALMNVLHLQGKLPTEQEAFMKANKPDEELFDLRSDPNEVHNLADNPQYKETLIELRKQLAKWRKSVGDEGVTPAFRSGGCPSVYPTRPLAEWIGIEGMWEDYILHGGKKPRIPRPQQFHGPWEAEH
jgi:N-sulfoglucosamine sulfohydrolase